MSYQGRGKGRPKIYWRNYITQLGWEQFGVPPDELEEGHMREVWASLLGLLKPMTQPVENGWMDCRLHAALDGDLGQCL